MVIDVHTHVVPASLPFGSRSDPRWPAVIVGFETGDVIVKGTLFRRVRRAAWDLDARLAEMATAGIDAQVLSPMPLLFSYWAPADEAIDFSRALNSWIAEAVRAHPLRFFGLGTVPLQDPDAAAAMLVEIRDAGLHGVELGTNINGVGIADRRFRPVFEEASRLGLSLFIHAFEPPFPTTEPAANAIAFPTDMTYAATSLIASGTLDGLSDLRVCLSHGGGGLALTLHRLTHAWRNNPAVRASISTAPDEVARSLFYDILTFDPGSLKFVMDTFGHGQIVVGSDYPFLKLEPQWPLSGLRLPDALRRDVQETNARRFLGLNEARSH